MFEALIKRGTLTAVAALIVCVLGIVAALRIPVQMIPDLEVRTITVSSSGRVVTCPTASTCTPRSSVCPRCRGPPGPTSLTDCTTSTRWSGSTNPDTPVCSLTSIAIARIPGGMRPWMPGCWPFGASFGSRTISSFCIPSSAQRSAIVGLRTTFSTMAYCAAASSRRPRLAKQSPRLRRALNSISGSSDSICQPRARAALP